ncbi:hypothetical protein TWF730_002464 [Orbilia blumenaviensis]|uniref:Uncharacterized protein n=1 Tax=Orbilia blumenaviensis TaxID=1796055 RepID=A0AAV9UBM0_9PEZI
MAAEPNKSSHANTGTSSCLASFSPPTTPRKPQPPKLHSPSRLRFVMNADTPIDMFSPPQEPPMTPIITRKPLLNSPSPLQYPLYNYNGPYFARVRRFQSRVKGVYEKIHEEWIKKALLKQEKGLKWDPKTGEPLFKVPD